ncbi:hypothetical protein ZIOFF_037619 [Zingiber officinale]|uniref:Uncharacterized protein n=1 Tax=Zingiber officinale TaxID=94328 RepID=A0A8J5GG84_ZINOF|nr:hypothetical protein ZIOFF_037619 [Zingiber officinale]
MDNICLSLPRDTSGSSSASDMVARFRIRSQCPQRIARVRWRLDGSQSPTERSVGDHEVEGGRSAAISEENNEEKDWAEYLGDQQCVNDIVVPSYNTVEVFHINPHGLNIVAAVHDPYKRVVRGLASIPCYNLRTSLAGVNCNLIDRSRKARRMVYKVEEQSKFRRQKSIKKGEAQQQETIMRLKKDCKFKKRGFSEEQVAISSAMLLIACIACSPPS